MLGVSAEQFGAATDLIVIFVCMALLVALVPRTTSGLVLAALVGLSVGYCVTSFRDIVVDPNPPATTTSTIVGRIVSDPRLGANGSIAWVEWSSPESGQIETLILYSGIGDIGRGDVIEVSGRWSDPSLELLYADKVRLVDRAGSIDRLRRSIRNKARERVLDRVPGSGGSLALGLIIGDDSGLTARERDHFRASGLSHITAVSGSNVVLVIGTIAFLLRALNRTGWLWFFAQLTGIIFYVWIVGADPPILRAAIMASLILLAGLLGRPTHLFTLLALAGGAMCLLDSAVLMSLGFQLSFLSMIGLGLASNLIARMRGKTRKIIAALLSPTAAALLTAPLLAARFGTFSFGAVPANVVVAPLVGPATVLAGLVAVVPEGFFTGDLLGAVLWALAGFILWVSRVVGGSPHAVLMFAPLSRSQTVAVYLLLSLVLAPFAPEVRVLAFRIRRWVGSRPARAGFAIIACAVMGVAFILSLD